ncbi:MAG: hypothetical protein U0836_20390 [Pirellulales bacterium]
MEPDATSRLTLRRILVGILWIGVGLAVLRALDKLPANYDLGFPVEAAAVFGGVALIGAGIGTFFGGPYRWAAILVVIAVVWACVTH